MISVIDYTSDMTITRQDFWTQSYNANHARLAKEGNSPRKCHTMAERAADIATAEWVRHRTCKTGDILVSQTDGVEYAVTSVQTSVGGHWANYTAVDADDYQITIDETNIGRFDRLD